MYPNNISIALKAAEKAARAIARDFIEIENLQISKKSINDFVTEADMKAEKAIIQELTLASPKFGILIEESGLININENLPSHMWIVDPIDGTSNFIHGNPNFAISIALQKTGAPLDQITAGLIYLPAYKEFYWAEKGSGAYHVDNMGRQRRIKVANRSYFSESLFS